MKSTAKQLMLVGAGKQEAAFGGALSSGRRKKKRPLNFKRPIHLVVRSSRAKGPWSFLTKRNASSVDRLLRQQARKHHLRLIGYVNVGNHLHIKLRAFSRDSFQAFLRSSMAMLARKITGAKKGHKVGKFWDALAFTRILYSSFEERNLSRYFKANELEARFGSAVRALFLGQKAALSSA